jgi:hypothetical protein
MALSRTLALGAFLFIATSVSLAMAQQPLPPPPAPPPTTAGSQPHPAAPQPAPSPAPSPAPAATWPAPPVYTPPPVAPPYAPPGYWGPITTVPLDLTTSTEGAGFEVYFESSKPGIDAPLASCPGSCRVFVYPGKYRIQITETEDTVRGNRLIEVRGPMSIDFDPDTSAKRTGGLILGIAGPIMLITGVMLVLSDEISNGYDDHSYDNDTEEAFGVLLMAGGLAATPIGWVMFGTSFKPEYQTAPALRSTSAPQPQWSFGPAMTGSGLGLAGTGTF